MTITLNVDSNPGFYSMRAYVDYDSSHMTLRTVSADSGLQMTAGDTGSDPYTFYVKNTTICNYTGTGAIATFVFSLSGSDGEQYAVRLIPIEAVDTSGKDISVIAYGVMATNGSAVKGDVNGDGRITLADSLLVDKYLAGYRDLGVSTSALDINGDGKVTLADSLLKDKHLAGYDVGISAVKNVDIIVKDGSDTQTIKGGIEGRIAYVDIHSSDSVLGSGTVAVKEYRSGVYSFTVTKDASGVCALEIQAKQAQSYTISYTVDGTVRHTETHAAGDSLTAWSYSQTGKTVSSWSPSVPSVMPDSDLAVTATTSWINYTIAYMVDGSMVHTETHHYGDSLTAWTYSAAGKTVSSWSPSIPSKMPAQNFTVYATTSSGLYTITYLIDGVVKHTDSYAYGANITAWKYSEVGKTISSWSPSLPTTMPAQNLTVRATSSLIDYMLTYEVDGATKHTEIHNYGDSLTAWRYTETGKTVSSWNPTVPSTMPASNLTLKATTSQISYKLTYIVDGVTKHTATYHYGDSIAVWTYSETGKTVSSWSPTVPSTMPADNVAVMATTTPAEYTLTYIVDGTVRYTETHNYGDSLTAWEYTEAGKTVSSWDPSVPLTMPAKNLTVSATTAEKYRLTFVVDKVELYTKNYAAGETISAPAIPYRANYSSYWVDLPETMPARNLTVEAHYHYLLPHEITSIDELINGEHDEKYKLMRDIDLSRYESWILT